MTIRRALLATALAAGALGVAAPAANACTGLVCEAACDVLSSKPVQKVADVPCPK